ncbi:olfactory receptor 49-like [Manis pentadactyla]|uniref:olfactory receptor 49-like n=1 Tax=Manis pentadactyla TaxID=143292 RepID=UPI001874E3F6|nr:olfactory receptor 49-like [Manis pentadactyla]
MDHRNKSLVTKFILPRFKNETEVEILFSAFLLMYMIGNSMIVLSVCGYYRLHSLSPCISLSPIFLFLEVAKDAGQHVFPHQSNILCRMSQSFFYFLLGSTEFFILAVMSFDRYVVICNPLRYAMIMNKQTCILLLLGSYVGAFLSILASSILTAPLPFCGPNVINHFFCDSAPVLKLVCADTSLAVLEDFISSVLLLLGSLLLTEVSYTYIVITILRIPSSEGCQKAFSTCVSHITMVTLYYGSSIFLCLSKKGQCNEHQHICHSAEHHCNTNAESFHLQSPK